MDLFQGLEKPGALQHHQHIHQQPVRCWSGATHTLVATGADTSCVVQLSAKENLFGPWPDTITVTANLQHLAQPGELLCVCQCPGAVQCSVTSSQPAASDLLALFKDGCKLRLCSVGQQAAAGQLHLIAEFEHEGFAELEACDCHVLPGQMVLLQPEPGQVLVLLRAAQTAAAGAATLQAVGWENAEALTMAEPAWQLLELSLPADAVLQAAVEHCPHIEPELQAYGVYRSSSTKGAGQWQLLHASSTQQGMLQLLLAVPAAGQGVQQQAAMLCLLHVNTCQDTETAAGHSNHEMKVIGCQLLHWPALPSCAAVWAPSNHPVSMASCSSPYQLAAVGSHAGDLLVLDLQDISSSSATGACCSEQHQQLQRHSEGGVIAAGRLSGAVEAIVHLPHVYACGACHHDVLAVLHKQQAGSVSRSSSRQGRESSMGVSLLRLQAGGQLQELTVIQEALGLCTPAHSPLGLLCPAEQQQLQHPAAVADQSALHLAAVIVQSSSSGSKQTVAQDEAATASSLGAHVWLDPSQAAGLPGPLLGILATAPDASITHAGCAVSAAGAVNNGTDAGGLGVQDSAELQGLQSMLSVLEGRWQQGTRELSAWQQRVVTAQRLAAAGHRHLCQLAADTLYSSTVRQFVVPVGLVAPGIAQAVHEAGRQLGEQQQEALAVLPPFAVPMQPDLQLLLQVVSIDSSLQDERLRLQVCVEPQLQCMLLHKQGANMPAWRGALLQPCHAELLLWHAGTAGVTVLSTWAWDAMAGRLTITATTGFDTLLQLHSIHSTGFHQAQAGISSVSRDHCIHGGKPSVVNGQHEVAQALAAAARRLTGSMPGCSGSIGSSWQSGTLQLQAAIAVSACCSTQAVVQWDSSCQQQQLTAGQRLLQRTQLLSPATALLHLQPVRVSVQDILLQQVSAQTPGSTSAQPTAAADLQAAVATKADAVMHACSKDDMQTPVKASAADQVHGYLACLPDVVPPTPCSVIPDSQEDEEQHSHGSHERRQQLQRWWHSQQQPAALSAQGQAGHDDAEVCSPGGGDNSRQGAASDVQAPAAPAGQHVKLLLVQSSGSGLHLLSSVLQRMQCFHAMHNRAAGSSKPCQQFVLKAADQHSIPPQQQLGAADLRAGSLGGAMIGLVHVDAHSILVKLAAPAMPLLGTVHQLLALALRGLPAAASHAAVQVSCLDEAHQGRLAAATQCLADATHLHMRVLEDMLHQENNGVALSGQQQLESLPLGVAATLAGPAEDSAAPSQDLWAACLLLQADVDLAVAQMRNIHM